MSQYIQVTESFYARNNFYPSGPNLLYIVKILDGRYVTSENSYQEFQDLFDVKYNFVLVDQNFYNEYNGVVLFPEMTRLYVRITQDNRFVVDESMRGGFSYLFTMQEPILQYTMMEFQDTYLTLGYDDFDHSNDIVV